MADRAWRGWPIVPVPKPRQTRKDKWQVRPAVARYRRFADECRLLDVAFPPIGAWVIFVLPMPHSWTRKQKAANIGQFHRQTPDLSNLVKALEDALYKDDSAIADMRASKIWGNNGAILVGEITEPFEVPEYATTALSDLPS